MKYILFLGNYNNHNTKFPKVYINNDNKNMSKKKQIDSNTSLLDL